MFRRDTMPFSGGLKLRIKDAQLHASLCVNRELILLYWQIGSDIRSRLMYMRAFAEAYPDDSIVQQVVGQIPWGHKPIGVSEYRTTAALPGSLKGNLPSIEELEAELQKSKQPHPSKK